MKKVYLSIFLAGLGCNLSYGQYAPKAFTANEISKIQPKEGNGASTQKALGIEFWADDFSTPATWTVDNSGQTGATFGWSIDAVKDGWWAPTTAIASTSEGNFAELTNGNPTLSPGTQALNVVYNLTTATPIDLTTYGTDITLSFEQYGARFNDLQEIQISVDGTNFIPVGDNSNYAVLSQSGGSAYPNPALKLINLSTFISGATQLWIRFSWTTAYPSQATNANVWVAYGWYIDDVALTTNPDYDLAVDASYWGTAGLNYYQIPTTQVAPIDFSVELTNGGTMPMTNIALNVDINAGAFVGTSTPVTIAPLASDSVGITTQFTPSVVGTYAVTRSLTSTEVDDVPVNNVLAPINFSVTNYIYARDNGTVAGSTSNGTDGFETGNYYDIWTNQTLRGINVRLAGGATGTTIGEEIFAKLYSVDPANGDFIYEGESDPLIVAAGNLNTNLVMVLQNPVNLIANTTYLAVVGSYGTGLKVSNAGTSEPQTSFLLDMFDGTWYYQTSTPYVRLNFDPTLGMEESANEISLGNVFPNPTSGATTIDYSIANASNVNVEIVDVTGKVIYTANKGTQDAGANQISFDASTFNNGVYYVTISTEESTVTRKFIKK